MSLLQKKKKEKLAVICCLLFVVSEMWFCPRHRCSLCKKQTKRCCKLCTTAFCFAHLDNNMFPDNKGGLLCSAHSTTAVKPIQPLRKASYINRNTPVIEYEKPFVEKYKPPPPPQPSQKEKTGSGENDDESILMEPNLTDSTPIVVENQLLSTSSPPPDSSNKLNEDGVSVQVFYVNDEGQVVGFDGTTDGKSGEKSLEPFERLNENGIENSKF